MNRSEYASHILQLVDNSRDLDGASDEQVVKEIEGFLEPLEPKDRERFAQWGHAKCQSTADKCWQGKELIMYADKPKVLIVDDGGRRTSHKASIAMAMACLNMAVCNDESEVENPVMEITLRPGADLNELKVPAAMQKPTNGKRPNKDRYGSPYGVNSRQQR